MAAPERSPEGRAKQGGGRKSGCKPRAGQGAAVVATAVAEMETVYDVILEVREVRSQHTGSGSARL
jgi:hypothetical protein